MGALGIEEKTFALATIKRIADWRELKQKQLSDRSGVPQSQISKLFSGQAEPTDEVLGKLSRALGLKLADILHEAAKTDELEITGYLATPLTGLSDIADAELRRIVGEIRRVAADDEFTSPRFDIYWPGDYTHPKTNPGYTSDQVYLIDRSQASSFHFIVLLCAQPSYGVGQENEIATQAGLPAIRLVPRGLSRMMLGSFIRAIDVPYTGDLATRIDLDVSALAGALKQMRVCHFRQRALYKGMNGNDFGERLRRLVNDRHQGDYQAFADDLGVNHRYVLSLMEEPFVVSNPSARLLQRMSCCLGVSIAFLLGEGTEADAVVIESRASWRAWIDETPGIDARIAHQVLDEWEDKYTRSRKAPQLASMRINSPGPMNKGEWDRRYQEALKAGKKMGGHGVQKKLLDS